jgi:16S rRNA G966 N2-methylase RsmD
MPSLKHGRVGLKNGPLRREIENAGAFKLVYIDPPFDVGADFSFVLMSAMMHMGQPAASKCRARCRRRKILPKPLAIIPIV